jgi:hypothetical protein
MTGNGVPTLRPRARGLARLTLLPVLGAAACELTEITLAEPEDVLVVEAILRADADVQSLIVHRSFGLGTPPALDIRVLDEADTEYRFLPAIDTLCLVQQDTQAPDLSHCYAWQGDGGSWVRPGARYRLSIEVEDGRTLTAQTTVPGAFRIVRPAVARCRLTADRRYTLEWSSSESAWVYIAETRLTGIRRALAGRGVRIEGDPLRLVGLSIGREDTTLVFPAEFGIFDRFEEDVSDALVALQGGLPPEVIADIVVGAADRNYVNWVRGGSFNPSGVVRVPSVFGERATGVFGSVVTDAVEMRTLGSGLPGC